jgi:uncharacterized protein (DUF885 family)
MNKASSAVARPNRSDRSNARAAADPLPPSPCNALMAASRSPTVNEGTSAPSCPALVAAIKLAHPTPTFPCRGPPESAATTASISSVRARESSSAIALTFADREEVAATKDEVAATSAISTTEILPQSVTHQSCLWPFGVGRPRLKGERDGDVGGVARHPGRRSSSPVPVAPAEISGRSVPSARASYRDPMPDAQVQAIAEDYWETFLEANPTSATILSDHRYDDRIEDLSAAGEQRLRQRWTDLATRVSAVDHVALDPDDRTTCRQLAREIGDAVAGIDGHLAELQSDQMTSYHVGLLISASLVAAPDPESAWKLVERLRQIPHAFEQVGQRFVDGVAAGRTPARVCVDRSLNVIDGYLESSLETDPFAQLTAPGCWDGEAEWRTALVDTVREAVRPAYRKLADLMRDRVLPVARDDEHCGLAWLDDGAEIYATLVRHHTTIDVSADEVHEFGLSEVNDKLPREYDTVGGRVFGLTEPAEVFERLRGDASLRYKTGEEIMAAARAIVTSAWAVIPDWFGRLPVSPCAIEPVPDFLAADSPVAYYVPPAPDGSRSGTYFVNTGTPEAKGRYEAASIGFHEAIPGHHLQLTIASERSDLPRFRRFSFTNAAYVEGWGLYAERLAEEMGLYPDDLDRIGMLNADSLRSCRLVVDTGLHALGWSRRQAVEFMATHTPMSAREVAVEVDRYIAMPGQALAYKVGQREIFRVRAHARSTLGARFDIKGFHDAVLGSGSVGLQVLSDLVDDWIDSCG